MKGRIARKGAALLDHPEGGRTEGGRERGEGRTGAIATISWKKAGRKEAQIRQSQSKSRYSVETKDRV